MSHFKAMVAGRGKRRRLFEGLIHNGMD